MNGDVRVQIVDTIEVFLTNIALVMFSLVIGYLRMFDNLVASSICFTNK